MIFPLVPFAATKWFGDSIVKVVHEFLPSNPHIQRTLNPFLKFMRVITLPASDLLSTRTTQDSFAVPKNNSSQFSTLSSVHGEVIMSLHTLLRNSLGQLSFWPCSPMDSDSALSSKAYGGLLYGAVAGQHIRTLLLILNLNNFFRLRFALDLVLKKFFCSNYLVPFLIFTGIIF
jgi:hypothetical protein